MRKRFEVFRANPVTRRSQLIVPLRHSTDVRSASLGRSLLDL